MLIIRLSQLAFRSSDFLRADDRVEALLAAHAVRPRVGVQAASDAHTSARVQVARACLGQLLASLHRRPVGLDRPLAGLVAPGAWSQPGSCRPPRPTERSESGGSAPIHPTSSTE